MGKRKQLAPQHADDAKRRSLHWNMGEQAGTSGAGAFIDDSHRNLDHIQPSRASPSTPCKSASTPAGNNSPSAFALQVDTFYQNLAACTCTLTLNSSESHKVKDKSNLLEFGRFRIDLIGHQDTQPLPQQLPAFRECWLYLSPSDAPSMLYFELDKNREGSEVKKKRKSSSRQTEFGIFWFAKLNVPTALLTDMGNRSFWFACDNFDAGNKSLQASVYAYKSSLILKPVFPSEPVRLRAPQYAVQKLMEYFFNIQMPYCPKELKRIKAHDFFELYENVMEIQRNQLSKDKDWQGEVASVHHPCLKPILRPYQRQSVAWMLRQEQKGGKHETQDDPIGPGLHPLYCEVTLPKGLKLYYNRYAGSFIQERPEAILPLPGGILADEMGLGKTVEVLCCMLLHPRTDVDQPKVLPVLDDTIISENSVLNDVVMESGSSKNDFRESNSSHILEASGKLNTSTTSTQSNQGEMANADKEAKNLQLEVKAAEDSNPLPNSGIRGNQSSVSLAVTNSVKLSSGCNPLLSDTGLPLAKEDDDVTALASSSGHQDLTDSESLYIDSSTQLQPDIASQESFSVQLEEDIEENEGSSTKLIETDEHPSSFEKASSKAENKVTESNSGIKEESVKENAEQNNQPLESTASGRRKRKSRGYIEYVPVTDDTVGASTYFSIQHAARQQWFECSCGRLEGQEENVNDSADLHTVKCIECGMSQHAECMNYDLRDPLRGDYLCPHCHATTIKSGATLIISPYSICHQWIEEIKKHIKERSITVFIYTGVSRLGYIQPQVLARQDIVITTYDVLRKELDYANLPHTNSESGRRFRHPKRFLATPSPMVAVEWWRTADMALRLKAVNRWCVTGTPLMRSVEDIYGLLLFLNVDPLRVQQWFRQLVWEPFCHGLQAPMHHALAQVFWRTAKKDVIDQLMSPLFRLRQACCHPQIVRGEFLPLNKTMMTMEELLEHMTKKVKTECEEAHRLIVASLNGMAGLAIIKDKIPEAVEKYREVLRSVEQNKDQFRTDDLQQLHAMHNLAQLLESKPDGVAPTLRDSQLKEQCEELKTKYMSKTKTNVAASLEGLETSQKTIKDLKMKLDSLDGDWWAEVVDMATQRCIDPDLVFKVKDDLLRTSTTEGTIAEIFNTANGLLYVVDQHLQALTSARVALTDRLDELRIDTSPGMVQAAATCCLRPADQVLKTGMTLAGDEGSQAYQVSTKRQGTWADSEVERTLKSILAFYKQNFETDQDILEAAAAHMKYMDALKKEFKTFRSVWLNHREMISAIDELEMATERLRLRGEFEPKPTTKILNVIEATDMFGIQASCSRDEIVGRNDLRKKLGQLLYLTNLAKRAEQGDNCNPDSCPICQSGLGMEWSVLMCGHCFCLCCMRTLIDRTLIGGNIDRRLKCPLCRFFTPVREISYVTTLKKERVNVKGSHSTKVQAVIECLIKIKQQDPSAKALVFSLWVSVLDILASALAENKISYKSLHDPNHFQSNLSAFKSDSDLSVLLLPLHVGANGLNLVEANHVLLVEPELNLEEEAQAISRVYRIGQTREPEVTRG
ncbi:E3 ubiquitin-protein ligase SHPRH [Elysia marginata]|uniref:E3 ubiquitin-protein ligase SHPRH n=1 Tax=Elysia marginata TaxID=1093978 RepID=A0AAV4JNV0_9GAST|nr:E3 ubiquitin-protein ligase SHPRH [Elysia marginata]